MIEQTRQAILLEEVKSTLVGEIIQSGFTESAEKKPLQRKAMAIFPIGNFLRPRAKCFDLIEIQFASQNRAMFVINFGLIPSEHIVLPWGKFCASEVTTTVLDKNGRAYANSYLPLWFGVSRFWPNPRNRAKAVVQRSIEALDDVEKWFSTGSLSSRIKIFENLTPRTPE